MTKLYYFSIFCTVYVSRHTYSLSKAYSLVSILYQQKFQVKNSQFFRILTWLLSESTFVMVVSFPVSLTASGAAAVGAAAFAGYPPLQSQRVTFKETVSHKISLS